MIVLDNDILVKMSGADPDPAVVRHLQQYSRDEWTIPSIVAFEFLRTCDSRTEMEQMRGRLSAKLDRLIDFTGSTALEAASLDNRLGTQDVSLDAAALLNLTTAQEEGCVFVTHNKNDFDREPIRQLANVDVVHTE